MPQVSQERTSQGPACKWPTEQTQLFLKLLSVERRQARDEREVLLTCRVTHSLRSPRVYLRSSEKRKKIASVLPASLYITSTNSCYETFREEFRDKRTNESVDL